MLDRWRRLVTGSAAHDATALFTRAQAVRDDRVAALVPVLHPDRGEPWADLDTSVLVEAQSSLDRLVELAIAWSSPASRFHHDDGLRHGIVTAVEWTIENRFHAGMDTSGNWWSFRIGMPLAVLALLVVVGDELAPATRAAAIAAVRSTSSDVSLSGANRAWTALATGLLGVVAGDPALISTARDGIAPLLADVSSGDGFHPDGSFVQHDHFAYTGGYGMSLLSALADLLLLLHGSPWAYPVEKLARIADWAERSFDPFLIDGVLMDAVRGREIAREQTTAAAAGATTLQAMCALSVVLDPAASARVAAVAVRHLAVTDSEFWRASDATRLALGLRLLDDVTAQGRAARARVFPAMRRAAVHGNGFAFAVASSGDPIARFECINGENLRGWYTGSGATWLYRHGPDAYAGDYWATVNPYRLAGTTVDTLDLTGITGTATIDPVGASGGTASADGAIALVAADDFDSRTGLRARKAWVLLGDRVIALASGITAAAGEGSGWDGAPRRIESILDNRPIDDADVIVADGHVIADAGTASAWLTWHRGDDDLGYVLLDGATVHVDRASRTGTWSAINTRDGDPAPRSQRFVEVWIDHGERPRDAAYAYVLLPGHDARATSAAAASPGIRVLVNDATAAGILECDTGTVAVHFWRAGAVDIPGVGVLAADAPATVLIENRNGGAQLTVAPAWAEPAATVDLDGSRVRITSRARPDGAGIAVRLEGAIRPCG